MKIKTSELTRAALNWAVRTCENGRSPLDYVEARDNFSTCWNKAGPIIEREKIGVWTSGGDEWHARDFTVVTLVLDGPTPLIAAMRCYVASKVGDVVDVPDELTA